LYKREISGIF